MFSSLETYSTLLNLPSGLKELLYRCPEPARIQETDPESAASGMYLLSNIINLVIEIKQFFKYTAFSTSGHV